MINAFSNMTQSFEERRETQRQQKRISVAKEYLVELEKHFQASSATWTQTEDRIREQARKLEDVARYSYFFNRNLLAKLEDAKNYSFVLSTFLAWRQVLWRAATTSQCLHAKYRNDHVLRRMQAIEQRRRGRPRIDFQAFAEIAFRTRVTLHIVGDVVEQRLPHYFQLWRL